MTPEPVQIDSALIGGGGGYGEESKHATPTRDVLAASIEDLRSRGIRNPGQFASLGADAIRDTLRWFDAQNGRIGLGVLVNELRAGGKPGWKPQRQSVSVTEQRDIGEQIQAWLKVQLPELADHPAAIAAVVRLRFLHGKGNVTRSKHGELIRAAAENFDRRYGREVA